METLNSVASMPLPREPADYDEISMQQNVLLSDSLKDLKNLRKQLYSAAEYFELSHTIDDQKQIVVDALKEYAVKALVNTVDHLGSVTYKVNDWFDEKVDEVNGTELRVSCIEQRLRTCQEYIDHEGISQQSLVIDTPKYHKRYIVPVGETRPAVNSPKGECAGCSLNAFDEDEGHQFRNAVRTTIRETPASKAGKPRSPSPAPAPSPQPSRQSGNFKASATIPKRESEKRAVSPYRFPLLRSESISSWSTTSKSSRPTTPTPSRPTTPTPSIGRQQSLSQPRKSASMRFHSERDNRKKDADQIPSKGKRLLKALLSRRKSKKEDDMLYTYLDEFS